MTDDVKKEEASTSEQNVPYSRFKEVNEAKNQAEQDLQALKETKTEDLTPDQQKEKQAKDFLKGLVKEQLKEEDKAKKATEAKEQKKFDSDIRESLDINPSINKKDLLKFIEDNSDKYSITSVAGAVRLYRDLNKIKDETVEETKENLAAKPKLPKSKAVADTAPDYSDDKGKTWEQVVTEGIKEAEEQGRK